MEERNEEKEYWATVVGRWLKSNQPREQDPDRDVARRPKMGTRFEGLAQLSHTSRARSRLKILITIQTTFSPQIFSQRSQSIVRA